MIKVSHKAPPIVRFMAKMEFTDTCWIWHGERVTGGYGRLTIKGKHILVHRYAYETFVGPIPEGLQIDHLCGVTSCANPAHLEPVTGPENVRRAFDLSKPCRNGHIRTAENLYYTRDGQRCCRICMADRQRRHLAKKRAA